MYYVIFEMATFLSLAASFIDPRSLALGAEYEVLQFLVVERTLLTLCSTYCLTPRTHFLVAGVIKEVVSWL